MDGWLRAALIICALVSVSCLSSLASDKNTVYVDRSARALKVVSAKGKTLAQSTVGIGRGGLARKRSMADDITPLGTFRVDLILSKDASANAVDPRIAQRFKHNKEYVRYLKDGHSLSRLFANMNSLDFDGDGKPDNAYGAAYIGLEGAGTGPKMSRFKNVVRWFSIALHGTPNESADIGKNRSGGCIHVPEAVLKRLISERMVSIGTRVVVHDSPDAKKRK